MARLTTYERAVRDEIAEWQEREIGWFARAMDAVGKPVEWMFDNVVPNVISNTLTGAVLGALEMLKDGAYWTYSDAAIVRAAQREGLRVEHHRELAGRNLAVLDRIASSHFAENRLAAALEGGGTGLGGLALVAADVPALFLISFRAVQQIGASYGLDLQDPSMRPIVLSVFHAGSAATSAAKAAAIADVRLAATALPERPRGRNVAERAQTKLVVRVLKQRAARLPKDIAENVSKRKLAQAIPLFGMAVGAGFNYWLLHNVTQAAYMSFRELHLQRKLARPARKTTKAPKTMARPGAAATRCSGRTQAERRCKRRTRHESGRCGTHRSGG